MTIDEMLDFIYGIPRFNKKLGLKKIKELLNRMGNPENSLKFVHVAGTNGKGSTCTMLSNIFQQGGYKTGLFISPHVLKFGERIQINGEMISDEDLIEIGSVVKAHWESMKMQGEPPSEFEVILAIGLEYYKRSGCDVVVLETGMGGRIDATNAILAPLVSVITSISLEHTMYLGDTIEKIAGEKAGIIKANSPAISYPKQDTRVLAVLFEKARETGSTLYIPHGVDILQQDIFGSRIIYMEREYDIPLGGEHQVWNTLTVLETCHVLNTLGYNFTYEEIYSGIKETHFPARLEVLGRSPLILLDGAHNLAGMEALVAALKSIKTGEIHCVFGVLEGKDAEGIIQVLAPVSSSFVVTKELDSTLFIEPVELAKMIEPLNNRVTYNNNPYDALKEGYSKCGKEDVLLICGSLYLASTLRTPALELGKGK